MVVIAREPDARARQEAVTLTVPGALVDRIAVEARRRGMAPSRYAGLLIEAAWAARHGKTGDADFDARVGAVLAGAGTAAAAAPVGEAVARRIAAAMAEPVRHLPDDAQRRNVTVRFAPDEAARVNGYARRRGVTVSAAMRAIVLAVIAEEGA